ncbi:MAG: hypothetical protein E7395_05415 [Ruminococcaceae bacterium]|nr:hypothetical protein [Oscillospiraceae bacterium]
MEAIGKIRGCAENIDIKEVLTNSLEGVKGLTNQALTTVRSMSRLDIAICSAVMGTLATIIAAIFSKTFKKLFSIMASICVVGVAYLLYKKYFEK